MTQFVISHTHTPEKTSWRSARWNDAGSTIIARERSSRYARGCNLDCNCVRGCDGVLSDGAVVTCDGTRVSFKMYGSFLDIAFLMSMSLL